MARKKKAAPVEPVEDAVVERSVVVAYVADPVVRWDTHPGRVNTPPAVIGEGTAADVVIEAAARPDAEMEIKQAAMWLTKWRNKHAK